MAQKIRYPRAAKQANYTYTCDICGKVCWGATLEEAQGYLTHHKEKHGPSGAVILSPRTGRPKTKFKDAQLDGFIMGVNGRRCPVCNGKRFIGNMPCAGCGAYGKVFF